MAQQNAPTVTGGNGATSWNATVTPKKLALHITLFIATFLTMMLAVSWFYWSVSREVFWNAFIGDGLIFALSCCSILLAHEMGHYLAARRHGIVSSLPYFIPAPPPIIIGTFGAVIRMKGRISNKNALLDVGAAGPVAGFLVTVPLLVIGLSMSSVGPMEQTGGVIYEGNSLLYLLLKRLTLGPVPAGHDVFLHPMAWAGWIGLLVTGLNLLPFGQLDGGHIVYALGGPKLHGRVGKVLLIVFICLVLALAILKREFGLVLWMFLILLLGRRHPQVDDPGMPLNRKRTVTGWACMLILVLSFAPVPLSYEPPWQMPWSQRGDEVEAVMGGSMPVSVSVPAHTSASVPTMAPVPTPVLIHNRDLPIPGHTP